MSVRAGRDRRTKLSQGGEGSQVRRHCRIRLGDTHDSLRPASSLSSSVYGVRSLRVQDRPVFDAHQKRQTVLDGKLADGSGAQARELFEKG